MTFLTAMVLSRVPSCGPPQPAAGTVTPGQLEAFSRLNDFRGPDLVPTAELMVKAQEWSEHMASQGQISHSQLTSGIGPGWAVIGENVAVATSLEIAQTALENSPGHRANMLDPRFSEGGVGVVWKNGNFWVTQDFVGR